jgi:imidazolonepropionase
MVIGHDGKIVAIGTEGDLSQYDNFTFSNIVDARGKSIIPGHIHCLCHVVTTFRSGLVDGHTHPVWSGDRVHEFKLKLRGATYMEIHAAGGGIGYTVRCTRESSRAELEVLLKQRLDRMLTQGTTTIEAKSG